MGLDVLLIRAILCSIKENIMDKKLEVFMQEMERKYNESEIGKNNNAIDAMINDFIKKANEKRGKNDSLVNTGN